MNKLIKRSNLYLGLFLLLLGLTFLLDNLGVVNIDKMQLLRLWPFLLIVWGLKYIPMRETVRFWVNIGVIILFFGLLLFGNRGEKRSFWEWSKENGFVITTGNNDEEAETTATEGNDYHFFADADENIKEAEMKITVGAAELVVENPTDKLYEFIGENISFALKNKYEVKDGKAYIAVFPESGSRRVKLKKFSDASMEIKLNPSVVWAMEIEAGAAELDLDLKPFPVKNLDIHAGAADIDVILGDKYPETHVTIEAGASNLQVHVPENAAVELQVSNVLGAGTYTGFTQIKKNLYRTGNFEDKNAPKIYLVIQSALSNFELDRY